MITLVNGPFTNASGAPLASGRLRLTLSQEASRNTGQVVPTSVSIDLDANGNIATPTSVYGNDELEPAGTFYTLTAHDSDGAPVYGPIEVLLTGGGTIDVGTLDPLAENTILVQTTGTGPFVRQTGARIDAKILNSVRYADQFDGADWSAKILAAINDLPSAGGTVDCGGLTFGSQVVSFDPFTGITKLVQLRLGAVTLAVNVNMTVPENIALFFPQGAIFSIATGTTTTLNGPFVANNTRVFTLNGTGTVEIGPRTTPVLPTWFGADDTGVADSAAAFQAAINSLPSQGGRLFIPPISQASPYLVQSSISVPSFVTISGSNENSSSLTTTGNATTIFTTPDGSTGQVFRDIELIGPGAGSTAPGILLTNTTKWTLSHVRIRLFGVGLRVVKGTNSSFLGTIFDSQIISNNTINIDLQALSNNIRIYGTTFGGGPAQKGIRFVDSDSLYVSGGNCEGVSQAGVDVDGVAGNIRAAVNIVGVHFENNKSSMGGDINIGATNSVLGGIISGCIFSGDGTASALAPVNFNKAVGWVMTGNTIAGGYVDFHPQYGTVQGITLLANEGLDDFVSPHGTALALGIATKKLGVLNLAGNTSGTVSIQPQAAAGTYSFVLPTTGGTTGQPLLSGGGSNMTFGTVGVAAGGTGLTSGTSGGILGFTAAGTIASSAALTANVLTKGGGAGATPSDSSITDNGSYVTTALPILLGNGTAAAPSLSFLSRSNYGFWLDPNNIVLSLAGNNDFSWNNSDASNPFYAITNSGLLGWTATFTSEAAIDTILSRRAAATLQLGDHDAAAPVAQTIAFQGSRGGTDTNIAGQDAVIQGSLGTGNAAPGQLIFKTGVAQASGSTQHVATTALTLTATQGAIVAGALSAGAAKATWDANGLETKSNNLTLAGQGKPLLLGITSQKAESAADANVLTVTPAAAAGRYRLTFSMQVSAQNTATLGWTATWTDSNGSAQAPTNLSLFKSGTAAPALTFVAATNDNYYGYADIDINNAGANIVIKLTFSGTSFTAKVSAAVERLI